MLQRFGNYLMVVEIHEERICGARLVYQMSYREIRMQLLLPNFQTYVLLSCCLGD